MSKVASGKIKKSSSKLLDEFNASIMFDKELYKEDIKALQFEAFIQLKEAYQWNTKKRYETLLKQLDKIDNSILEIDTSKMQIKDLFTIKNDILLQLDKIERNISTDAKVTQTDMFGEKEHLKLALHEVE